MKILLPHLKTLCLLCVAALLAYFVYGIDWSDFFTSLTTIGLDFIWVILVSAVGYIFATKAWSLCLRTQVDFWQLFQIRHVGEMLSVINPSSVIAGDSLKYFMLKDVVKSRSDLAGSLILSRMLIMLGFVGLGLSTLIVFVLFSNTGMNLWKMIIPVFVLFILIIWFIRALVSPSQQLYGLYSSLQKGWFGFLYKPVLSEKIKHLNNSCFSFYRERKHSFYWAVAFSFLHWLAGAFEYWLILKLFGLDIHFGHALILETGVVLCKSLLAFIPGQFGVEELANKFVLQLIQVGDPSIWLSLSVIKRLRQICWIAIACLFYFFGYKSKTKLTNESPVYHA